MLQAIKAVLPKEYREEWQIKEDHDFYHLAVDNVFISNNIYRNGGFSGFDPNKKQEFFLVLKGVEELYSKNIIGSSGRNPKHIAQHWTAMNDKGEELIVCREFASVYLIKDSCILCVDRDYYNLRTKEKYPFKRIDTVINSCKYSFLGQYTDNIVYKIDKQTGEYEQFN